MTNILMPCSQPMFPPLCIPVALFEIQVSRFCSSTFFNPLGTPLVAGLAVAAAALAGRYGIQAWQAFKARPPTLRKFYEGGFQPTMTRREAALILGIRESTPADKVKEAHRKVMVANHPDAGGSHYLASKINEAKDMMLGKTRGSESAF
ncbi:Mitochondrial import inner membrane translocase subunit TIM14-1 [Vitis vinifera]|uniref:Mitochondrial import inner membrane translocase subunit TIM14-1 n=1 Tax=Vitis vinifera TaxID=29760 RepID=A0A438DWA6_VITVI|nr:Mitochondrial import inner membrane translocase subunit TIM14-1 [Vitis vinifera]